jgi:hypothetical protein
MLEIKRIKSAESHSFMLLSASTYGAPTEQPQHSKYSLFFFGGTGV